MVAFESVPIVGSQPAAAMGKTEHQAGRVRPDPMGCLARTPVHLLVMVCRAEQEGPEAGVAMEGLAEKAERVAVAPVVWSDSRHRLSRLRLRSSSICKEGMRHQPVRPLH